MVEQHVARPRFGRCYPVEHQLIAVAIDLRRSPLMSYLLLRTTRFRPSDFAWYRALSALSKAKLISASPARTVEMPKLAVMRIAITLPEAFLCLTDVLMAARLTVCRADPKEG